MNCELFAQNSKSYRTSKENFLARQILSDHIDGCSRLRKLPSCFKGRSRKIYCGSQTKLINIMNTLAFPSAKLKKHKTITVVDRTNSLRRAFFASSLSHSRWNVGVECVISQVNWDDCKRDSQPDQWVEDVVIACACIRGEQQAWHHVQFANTWRLREAAELRLSPEQASLLVERFWRVLRTNSRAANSQCANGLRMQNYRGGQMLTRWLLSQILTQIEALPLGSSIDAILDTMPQLRTLGCDASVFERLPQAT